MAVLAAVTLILGLFVVRPLLARPADTGQTAIAALPAAESGDDIAGVLADAPDTGDFDLPDLPMISGFGDEGGGLPDLNLATAQEEDPVDRLRSMIGERQEETVEILRSWLEDKEESA